MARTMKRPSQLGGPQSGEFTPGFMGREPGVIMETLTATSDATITLTGKLPPYSNVIAVQVKCAVAGTITTGTVFLFGISGNTDNFADITFTAIDAVGDIYLAVTDEALFTGADEQAVEIGADSGTLTTGSWDLCIWYDRYIPFETAS